MAPTPVKYKRLCVYCSSSNAVAPIYFEQARQLGRQLADRDIELVYGAGNCGLMGAVAESCKQAGGQVIGVVPGKLDAMGLSYDRIDDLKLSNDLRDRKEMMDQLSDGFIALPGGFGTLDEVCEMIALKQLHYHDKPIVLLNTAGFFEPILRLFEHFVELKFAKTRSLQMFYLADSVDALFGYLDGYQGTETGLKWFNDPSEPID